MSKNETKGSYIHSIMEKHSFKGDAYINIDELYKECKAKNIELDSETFKKDLKNLLASGQICLDENKCYLYETWEYENYIAERLREIILDNSLRNDTDLDRNDGIFEGLCKEQNDAVNLAFSSRLSIITGGAGSGKTTLIKAIVSNWTKEHYPVLCAPTGKAAINLSEKVGYQAKTIHKTLGIGIEDKFISSKIWEDVGIIIIDEASMLTLEMFAGILSKMNNTCHLVLLGDPNQLLAVGVGDILNDLVSIGIPFIHLKNNHRQELKAKALMRNVIEFTNIKKIDDFNFDESCVFFSFDEKGAYEHIVREAADHYLCGRDVQVLTPFNSTSMLSVNALNKGIREIANVSVEGKMTVQISGEIFRDGDRVIITKNDSSRNCYNGEIGTLRIKKDGSCYAIILKNKRCPKWSIYEKPPAISLAYALTVHKSQGDEYDKIFMPIVLGFSCMLNRNLLYTAISRAKKNVVFYGSHEALSLAITETVKSRQSNVINRVNIC